MGLTSFPNGASSFGIPILGSGPITTTGSVFFVDDSGSNSNSGTDPAQPFADLDYAIGKCTAGLGDIIVLMPGHAETASTQITCDIANVRIIGLGVGRGRPAITAHGSAVDCFNVTAANVSIENIRIIGATSCTALINVAGADFYGYNLSLEHGAAPTTGVTMASGADRFTFERCKWHGTAAGPNFAIDLEAHLDNWEIKECTFDYVQSDGIDDAVIRSNTKAQTGGLIRDCWMMSVDALIVDINSSTQAQGDGMLCNVYAMMTSTITSIETAIDLGAFNCLNVYVNEGSGTSSARIPIASCT